MNETHYRPDRDVVAQSALKIDANLSSEEGARLLAYELNEWWHARGFPQVQHWIEHRLYQPKHGKESKERAGIWTVKSNLVNGLPPRQTTP
jgi:hypothetical protein